MKNFLRATKYQSQLISSALKSGPVSVLLPFLEGLQTGPVPEGFRMQEPRTGTAKNCKKTVVTSLGMNIIKRVLNRQNADMCCENKL